MKTNIILITLIITAVITGCNPIAQEEALVPWLSQSQTERSEIAPLAQEVALVPRLSQSPVAGVHAGLTSVNPKAYKGWRGQCPGTDIDAWINETTLTSYGYPATTLYNSQATAAGIIAAVTKTIPLIQPDGLLWLSISGHGSYTRDTNGDEPDGRDEQLCLWDGKLNDDKVWILLNRIHSLRPDIRILFISDTCHSGTNFRGTPLTLAQQDRSRSDSKKESLPNLLHFGGCSDTKYSYGSTQGGIFTTALLDTFDLSLTYRQWFAAAKAIMPKNQRPTIEHTGTDFGDRKIFK